MQTFLIRCAGALAASALLNTAGAASTDYRQSVGGYALYLGVVPAEIVRGHAAGHEEATMHGGPRNRDSHHIVVSIRDERSGRQVTDATVEASVEELGLSQTVRKLVPMRIAGTTTYGNFFTMSGAGPFRIEIRFRPAGASGALNAVFNYTHPNYH